jgi:L-ornithine Nalpha-acyltransferase
MKTSLSSVQTSPSRTRIRLAKTAKDIEAAQRLRYKVFYEEWGAIPTPAMRQSRTEPDPFDEIMDHLIVIDEALGDGPESVIGTYRLLRGDVAKAHGKFYTSHEFDISSLHHHGGNLLELGRSCVLAPYRTMAVLQLLWQGISSYVTKYKIDTLFGCACLRGTNIDDVKEQLSYLYYYHLADETFRPRALDDVYVNMNLVTKESIDVKKTFISLEPLIKGYLRAGCMIGDGAYIDHQFNSVDVCIVLPTTQIAQKYRHHFIDQNQISL